MKILKFGGSSISTKESIETIGRIIKKSTNQSDIAVVVSALQGVTDNLIELAKTAQDNKDGNRKFEELKKRHMDIAGNKIKEELQKLFDELGGVLDGVNLLKELSPRSMDLVLSFGERLSAKIVTESLKEAGIKAEYLDAREVIVTDAGYGSARVDVEASSAKIKKYFSGHKAMQIVTGFIGATPDGITTTLGRGGSDYTASLLASALDAEEIQLWKDTDGVMTANPKKVKKAFSLDYLSYEEAMELSHFGARVIYPPTIQPAYVKNIPIRILNAFNTDFPGTLITNKEHPEKKEVIVKGITSIEDIAILVLQGCGMIGVSGISARLFGAFAKEKISVVLITQASSEHSICVAVEPKNADRAKAVIEEAFKFEIKEQIVDGVYLGKDFSIIAIVGEHMKKTVGIAGKLFTSMARNGINVIAIAQGSSELNISVVIPKTDLTKALNAVHQEFFLSDIKTANLFVLGCTGNIGSKLIEQIRGHYKTLVSEQKLELKLTGIANSKKMYFTDDGMDYSNWQKELQDKGEKVDINAFVERIKKMNLPNSIFVDCTALPDLVKNYCDILSSSVSIITPNKNVAAGSYADYFKLKSLAKKYNTKYIYETNVGAGLPIVNTLADLVNSGDKILRFEGILSGTLSFIFTSFAGDKKFSDIVREAKERGFTEPDPRIDLSGMDFAKKILILAREIGLKLDIKDIKVQKFIPDKCLNTDSVESFFDELKKNDAYFEKMKIEAEKKSEKLKYIGTYENGECRISLQSINSSHPFYNMKGSDNIVSFVTERYNETPIVIKGPGAGVDVTAAGVLADIIRSCT